MIKNIAVYCGAAEGNRPEYKADAVAVAKAIANHGYGLVYGGGDIGLMGVVADTAMAAGGYVHGVIPHHLADKEIAHSKLSVLERVDDMRIRKARMEQLSQAFVVLPGGSGTLEEFYEIYTMQQLYEGMGPIVLFDTLGYWQPMLRMLEHAVAEGFLMEKYLTGLIVTRDAEDMISQIENWVSPGVKYE
ncbi:MAG: TIGR00730 family Rossman fold protein [Corynebacterium sp.]|nr:TIGR00730 family Rossman fold protein [Corynebacterium sp.]